MSKLPSITGLKREDFKDAPDWIDRFLSPLNTFMRTVYEALNGNLTFGDNISGFVKEFTITAGAAAENNTTEFVHGLKRQPTGLLIMQVTQVSSNYAPITSAVTLSWRRGVGSIVIDAITGLTNGTQYTFRVLVI